MLRPLSLLAPLLVVFLAAPTWAQEVNGTSAESDNDRLVVNTARSFVADLFAPPSLNTLLSRVGPLTRTAAGSQQQQPEEDIDETALAQQSQNPVADLISLPIQVNSFFNVGDNDRTRSVTNIQPVIPITIGPVNLINRVILPLVYRPDFAEASGGTYGFGDTSYTAFFSPARPSQFIWGAGPVALFPTASEDNLGTEKWGLGPSAVGLTMQGPWVMGALFNQIWSVGGDDDRGDLSAFLLQYFINYNMADGWFLTTAPIITANWNASDGNKWIVPFGGGIGRVFVVGRQPLNFNTQLFYNAVKPDTLPAGPLEWRVQLAFLFPQ